MGKDRSKSLKLCQNRAKLGYNMLEVGKIKLEMSSDGLKEFRAGKEGIKYI